MPSELRTIPTPALSTKDYFRHHTKQNRVKDERTKHHNYLLSVQEETGPVKKPTTENDKSSPTPLLATISKE